MRPCCQPRDTPILGAGGWWTNPKGVGLNVSYPAKNSPDARSPRIFPHSRLFRAWETSVFLGFFSDARDCEGRLLAFGANLGLSDLPSYLGHPALTLREE